MLVCASPQREAGGNDHVLGEAPGDVPADHPDAGAVPAVPGAAAGARPAAERRVDDHAVAGGVPAHLVADRLDVTGHVHAGDVREAEAGQERGAPALEDVEPVQRAGPYPDEHVMGTGDRVGDGEAQGDGLSHG